ncbi:ABC transporter ATP-binding protein [Schinkia azotoformans]|uniref:ABC transporter ATP-binding protein n=1 Tax=Schinkia azotoformans TaxID=1454 RepID=UPI002DB9D679|nr:ABC transporter ATP-binding protein [Schinkia azotoformans]MEC1720710.1 ABC transporter ATP-binding protein [Schinkia azotoformans]MED4352342.1 ABC transporter ATP-binding protein [Schinkia azotoformans]MED4411849.1 ABC transporter ATP-binding protein [Schinkia azotoformans]
MEHNLMVEVNDLSKIYSPSNRIEHINFEITKGECFALCGGNGAGKSTVIQMIIGNVKPSSGTIKLSGMTMDMNRAVYKSLFSYMPDAMVFPKVLTGYEVLCFFADLSNVPKGRVDFLLEKVGLANDKDKKVREYSKGMQQRLALAQSLLPEAPLLILDEPTNGLDPYWVREFKNIIKEEKEKGTTILFSSHILSDVEELADRVAFMNSGRLLVTDTVEALTKGNNDSSAVKTTLEEVFFSLVKAEQTV